MSRKNLEEIGFTRKEKSLALKQINRGGIRDKKIGALKEAD